MNRFVLTLQCNDAPGLIHRVAGALFDHGANILEQSQFTDPESGHFCLRTMFESPEPDEAVLSEAVSSALMCSAADIMVRAIDRQYRVMVLVSRFDHCLRDLMYRWQLQELGADIPVVVSNHLDCKDLVESVGIPFVHIPVTDYSKEAAEARLRSVVLDYQVDFLVLARYMQVLSDSFCQDFRHRIINIHHSFLPGFKGARPYHQAHERGVKLIGATAHFVTADLDEGPIIEQGVRRISHAATAADLVLTGRDIEREVLARAVTLAVSDRVFLVGQRTVVLAV